MPGHLLFHCPGQRASPPAFAATPQRTILPQRRVQHCRRNQSGCWKEHALCPILPPDDRRRWRVHRLPPPPARQCPAVVAGAAVMVPQTPPWILFFKKTARSALMAAPPAAYSFVGGSPCCEALPWPRGCRSLSFLTGALRIRKPRPQLGLLAAQLLVHALELRHPGAAAATRRLRRPPCGHQRRLCTVRRPRPLHPSKLDMALCSFSVVVPPPLRPLGATTPRPAIRT